MNFYIMTLFPEMVLAGLNTSIIGRAVKNNLLTIHTENIRDYSSEPHGRADDYPYGGGAGMVMQVQPIYDCYRAIEAEISEKNAATLQYLQENESGIEIEVPHKTRVLYTSPAGRVFDQKMAKELAAEENLIILCGHYEGVDERALQLLGAEDVSIGDYVLTGGELPAMVMVDAISRMVPGVLTNEDSGEDESFSEVIPGSEFTRKIRREVYGDLQQKESLTLLEYPQYTRPEEFMGLKVPEVLLSGHHANILKWRREQSLERTRRRRPDLL